MRKLFDSGTPTQVARNFVKNPRALIVLLMAAIFIEVVHKWAYRNVPNLPTIWVAVMWVVIACSVLALVLAYLQRPVWALALFIIVFNVSTTYHPLLASRSLFEILTGATFAAFIIRICFGRSGFLFALAANVIMLALVWVGEKSGYLVFPLELNGFQNSVHSGLWIGYRVLILYVLYAAISKEINNYLQINRQIKYNDMIVQNVSDAIVSCSLPDFTISSWNQAAQQIYGWTEQEAIGRNSQEVFKTHITLAEYRGILDYVANHGHWIGELGETHKNGHSIFVRVSFTMLKDESGQPTALVGVSQDITLQKQTAQALERREAILAAVHFAAERFLVAYDWQEHIDELLRRLGFATDALRVCLFEDRVESGNIRWTRECYAWQRHVESPELFPGELNFDDMGLAHWRQTYEAGQPISVKMSVALPAERDYMAMAGVSCKLGVPIFVDQKLFGSLCLGHMEDQSPWQPIELEALSIAANILGAAIERQAALRSLLQKQKLEEIGLLAGGIAHDFNNLLTGILSQNSLVERRLEPDHQALKHVHKVRFAAQRAADLTQKLLAYAGKSHFVFEEVNLNLVIQDTLDLIDVSLRQHQTLDLRLAPKLMHIWADESQLQQVVLNLLVNAFEASQKTQRCELADEPLHENTLHENTLHNSTEPSNRFVQGALQDVQGRNSPITAPRQALRPRSDVMVETFVRTVDQDDRDSLVGYVGTEQWRHGPYVCLRVRDNGVGMDAATASQIFTPFFSTKGSGRGLGLAASLGVIRALGGGIRVESQAGSGTLFEVLFPCLQQDDESPHNAKVAPGEPEQQVLALPPLAASVDDAEPINSLLRKPQTALVIDDEPSIRDATVDILELCNIAVLAAGDGPAGIELFRQHQTEIAFVIVDIEMPYMNGIEVIMRLYQLDPQVKILLSSGYTAEEISPRLDGYDPTAFLQKPYDVDRLIEIVQEFTVEA